MKFFSFSLVAGLTAWMFWMFTIRGAEALALQQAAESYPSVQGRMLSSEVQSYTGSKGSIHYRAVFLYEYKVNGREYRSRRYRYGGYSNDAATVNAIVAAHPVGSDVLIYYNPQNPADAVLAPRVEARDVFLLFLLTPITLILVFPLVKAGREINWPGRASGVAGGVTLITEAMVTRVRLPRYQPWMPTLIVAGILSVIAGILMACGIPMCPPMLAGKWSLLGVSLGGGGVFVWQCARIASGGQDLVIDEGSRTFQLPLTYKRRERKPMPFSQIRAVSLKKVPHRGRYGSVSYTYAATLQLLNGASEQLTDLSQSRAESLAGWLREKLGVPL